MDRQHTRSPSIAGQSVMRQAARGWTVFCVDATPLPSPNPSSCPAGQLAVLAEFSAQSVSNTLWAFATLRHVDEVLMKELAERALQLDIILSFKPQELANTAWAFAKLGFPHPVSPPVCYRDPGAVPSLSAPWPPSPAGAYPCVAAHRHHRQTATRQTGRRQTIGQASRPPQAGEVFGVRCSRRAQWCQGPVSHGPGVP